MDILGFALTVLFSMCFLYTLRSIHDKDFPAYAILTSLLAGGLFMVIVRIFGV